MFHRGDTLRSLGWGGRLVVGSLGALLLFAIAGLGPGSAQGQQTAKQRAEESKKVLAELEKLRARLKELENPVAPAPAAPARPGAWVGSIKVEGKLARGDRAKLARISQGEAEKAALAAFKNKDARVADAELKVTNGFLVWVVDVALGGRETEVFVDAGNGRVLAPADIAGSQVAVTRSGAQFTATCQDGAAVITVTGTVAGGQLQVAEISIQDGEKTMKVSEVGKVPEQWRSKVQHVIDSADKFNRAANEKKGD